MSLPIYKEQINTPSHPFSSIKAVIAVAAGKGGVGKSTVTCHLARTLKKMGYAVGVIDGDIYGPSIAIMLPDDLPPAQKGKMILPAKSKSGISTLSVAHFREKNDPLAVRAPIAERLVWQFIHKVKWEALDFLLIDFPPGTGDVQLNFCQMAQLTAALIVTTPQEVSLADVQRTISLFERVKVPLLGVIENMAYYQRKPEDPPEYLFGQNGGEKLAAKNHIPFIGKIPIDSMISHCGDTGQSLFEENISASLAATAFEKIAHEVICQLEALQTLGLETAPRVRFKDSCTLLIEWPQEALQEISLTLLQKNCPCMDCTINKLKKVPLDVKGVSIQQIGNYGIKIAFVNGCSAGIYSFDELKKFKGQVG